MRLAATAAAVLATLALAAPVSAQRFEGYVAAPPAAANAMWSDILAVMPPDTRPDVFWRTGRDADGRRITSTFFGAPVACGLNTCPTRVFVDDAMVHDEQLCSLKGEHVLDVTAHILRACDRTVRIDVPPADAE